MSQTDICSDGNAPWRHTNAEGKVCIVDISLANRLLRSNGTDRKSTEKAVYTLICNAKIGEYIAWEDMAQFLAAKVPDPSTIELVHQLYVGVLDFKKEE